MILSMSTMPQTIGEQKHEDIPSGNIFVTDDLTNGR